MDAEAKEERLGDNGTSRSDYFIVTMDFGRSNVHFRLSSGNLVLHWKGG